MVVLVNGIRMYYWKLSKFIFQLFNPLKLHNCTAGSHNTNSPINFANKILINKLLNKLISGGSFVFILSEHNPQI